MHTNYFFYFLANLFGCKGNRIALMDPHKKFLQILPSGEGIVTSKIMTNLKGSTITFEDLEAVANQLGENMTPEELQ